MKILQLLALLLLTSFLSLKAQSADLHNDWDKLLKKHVTNKGKVNYEGLKKDKTLLDAYLKKLQTNEPQESWSANAAKAYWINAYNAFTIKLVLNKYPIESITKIMDKPWDYKFIKIGKSTYSLNDIEHTILRKKYKDARIHFGVNCAAVSCPKIHNTAFTETNIDAELTKLAKAFINNKTKNQLSSGAVKISKIFEWYAEDFVSTNTTVVDYLNKYADIKIKPTAKVSYMEYNWALNN